MNSTNDAKKENLDWIKTRSDFLMFLQILCEDVKTPERSGWENTRLEDYLNGLEGFVHDLHGFYKHWNRDVDPEIPTWQGFAEILMGGAVYE